LRTTPKKVTKQTVEQSITEEQVTTVKPVISDEEPSPEPESPVEHVEEPGISGVEKREEKKLPKGTVKVKVLIGTLSSADGTYEKGETFTIARKELEKFDPRYYQIL